MFQPAEDCSATNSGGSRCGCAIVATCGSLRESPPVKADRSAAWPALVAAVRRFGAASDSRRVLTTRRFPPAGEVPLQSVPRCHGPDPAVAPSERLEKLYVLSAAQRENTGVEGDESHLVSSSEGRKGARRLPADARSAAVRPRLLARRRQPRSMPAFSAEGLQHATGVFDTNRAWQARSGWTRRGQTRSPSAGS